MQFRLLAKRYFNGVMKGILFMRSNRLMGIFLLAFFVWTNKLIAQAPTQNPHRLEIKLTDSDSNRLSTLQLKSGFPTRPLCLNYVSSLDSLLALKGFAAASVDSVRESDSLTIAYLYLGEQFQWGQIKIAGLSANELSEAGVRMDTSSNLLILTPTLRKRSANNPAGAFFSTRQLEKIQQQILEYLYNHGHPFASIQLDSLAVQPSDQTSSTINGKLTITKGLNYTLDSIQVNGKASISENFLHRYLDLPKGMPFQKTAFNTVSIRLRELPYLQENKPWALRFGGNGAILDLFLEPKKSSQINVLLGLLPTTNSTGENKFQVTGEANLNLKNALGNGETIGVNWQQLQVQSPRLNLMFQQPYLFGSAFGISTQFDLFKKDSSFLNINAQLGIQYAVSARQTGKVFLQLFRTNLVNVDTNRIKASKRLPNDIDMSIVNLGVDYELYTTNYRRNPRKGWELYGSVTAGTRTVKRNNAVLDIKDPTFNYASLYDTIDLKSYQFKIKARLAKFLPIGKQATIQLLANGGWVQSPSLFRNELFQIGGYKLMRGFDEESIFASRYLVNTVEYRYLVGINSYFFGFADYGFTSSKSSIGQSRNSLFGAGLGIAFETAAGFFNLSLAAGKRDDNPFNLRQTKIHLGYVNYF
ncbi:ShlB/FhaC/HecB family hemolysin secretion/activation protein [Flavihumibacter sp. UBA7668]|uniref:ShlB/FhaC/HecB family hemolysin secretion/activation protein n=1 Tax=Flavihumibacter sp. UBA7668 TaxID=1946542 RepID=UPI0025B8E942|nr:ShlB/FhaC/HecB family hemolysin secretion/activation protein [Flavihumibacter sp. UBA7668]